MDQLTALLAQAIRNNQAPFVVGAVANSSGLVWTGSAGEEQVGRLLDGNTVFRIVSMSKAVGVTAAAILADRGKLNWETPVEDILPEFGKLGVLVDPSVPKLRPPKTKATLRHLATHTSGLVYGFWDKNIADYLQATGLPPVVSGLKASLACPLAFDPGDRWQYGPGVDWLGLVIEALDGRSIDLFCSQEIFEPLGMNDTSFELTSKLVDRLVPAFGRSSEGSFTGAPINVDPPPHPEFYGMGHALYSTANDYMRFLRMWLNRGQLEGVRMLSENTVGSFLENHIGPLRLQKLHTALPIAVEDLVMLPNYSKSHSLGFARMEENIPGMRSKGSQFWGGVLNTHFWFDPERDLAAVLMTQLLPFLDPEFMVLLTDFEQAVYRIQTSGT